MKAVRKHSLHWKLAARFHWSCSLVVRRKKQICLVPVTRPYVFFRPTLIFFYLHTKTFNPIFYSMFKKWTFLNVHVNILKKHKKLDNFNFSFNTDMLSWLRKINVENSNTLYASIIWFWNRIFNLFVFVCKQMCALECWLFSGT